MRASFRDVIIFLKTMSHTSTYSGTHFVQFSENKDPPFFKGAWSISDHLPWNTKAGIEK
jgi:hypothetical protein